MPAAKIEFERAVHRGLGRAVQWLHNGETVPDRDFLLYACTHNLAFDRQCEDNRALYMFDMIQATGEAEFYVQALQHTLAEWDEDREEADSEGNDTGLSVSIGQIFDLLALAANRGNLNAKVSLYAFFEKHAAAESTLFSADALVAMDGLEGYLFAVRQWVQNPPQDGDQWYEGYLLGEVDERFGAGAVSTLLEQASQNEPALGIYLIKAREERAERHAVQKHRSKADKPTCAELRQIIFDTNKKLNRPRFWRWGEKISDTDAEQMARELLTETDPKRLARYLLLFKRRPFPFDHTPLLTLAQEVDQEVATAARAALAQIEHPSIRALALELMPTSLRPRDLIEMLTKNFCSGDEQAIERVLRKAWDADEMHRLTLAMRHLVEANPQPTFAGALMRLYEEGYCTMCRYGVIKLMAGIGPLPPELIDECRYDAYDDTRELIAEQTKQAEGTAKL